MSGDSIARCLEMVIGGAGDDQLTSSCICSITPRNCSCRYNQDLNSMYRGLDVHIAGSKTLVCHLRTSSHPPLKSKISEKTSKSKTNGCDNKTCDRDKPVFQEGLTDGGSSRCNLSTLNLVMLYFLISSLIFDKAHSQGVFIEVDDICIGTCVAQKDWKFNGNCPQTHCDYQCAAQRLAHQVGHRDGTEYHCALNYHNRSENRQTWAEVQNCKKGEQPYVMLYGNTIELPTSKWMIVCDKCNDNMYYNSDESTSSNTYNTCTFEKRNRCTPENHKINCGIPWEERTESDGYCRCDYEQGYAPFNGDINVPMCFYSEEECVIKKCPPGKELVSNYSCVPVCPKGYYRDKTSRECSRIISPSVSIPSVPPTTRNTTVQTPSQSTHGRPVVTFPSTSTDKQSIPIESSILGTSAIIGICFTVLIILALMILLIVSCKYGPLGPCLLRYLIVRHRRDSTYRYSEVNTEPDSRTPRASNGASGQNCGSSNASQSVHYKTEIHVQGDYIKTEGGKVYIKNELNDDIHHETPDDTPEINRRQNQQRKVPVSAEYGVCPVDEEDQPLVPTHEPTKQSSPLHQPIQNDLNPEKDLDVLNEHQEITDRECSAISNNLGKEWEAFVLELNITQVQIEQIQRDHPFHVQDQIRHALIMWRNREMKKGTSRDSLIQKLIDVAKCVQRVDLEETIHEILGKPLHSESDVSGGDDLSTQSEQFDIFSKPIQNDQSEVGKQTLENEEQYCDENPSNSHEQTTYIPNKQRKNTEGKETDVEAVRHGVTEHGEEDEPAVGEMMGNMHRVAGGLSKTVSPVADIPQERDIQKDTPEPITDEVKEQIAKDVLQKVIRQQGYNQCNWPAVLKWLQETSQTRGVELLELLRFPTEIVSHTQIKQERQDCTGVPSQFTAYTTSGNENSCLYQSVSVLLCGDEGLQYRLRLAAFVFIIQNVNDYVQQVIKYSKIDEDKEEQVVLHFLQSNIQVKSSEYSNTSEGITAGMNCLVQETPKLGVDSSSFHVDFLCGALQRNIESFYSTELVKNTRFIPWIPIIEGLTTSGQQLHIFWTSFSGDSGRLDHIVPLFKIE
ncbi:uncharacterized protein LOC128208763 isoform X2 [Mya arenaria]|uniref:uncharacterized protein LOC128208763 isoform X2 n=1 Tax=Mya arenaria TaxID=6604 RepID=UPI0022E750ED|nr:uncharacterized protein LOC128208763 isoform X2 [Mya arenaria]